jgi:hypothetical protein
MSDKHLNLFYTYNRDNQLIENNLTRAFIVTLRFLEKETCNRFLQKLLEDKISRVGIEIPSFHNVDFALQDNIGKQAIKNYQVKFVLAIASYRFEIADKEEAKTYDDSVPDAWIFDEKQGLCILIESKVGLNFLSKSQIASHAKNWLNIPSNRLAEHLLSISWHEISDLSFTFHKEAVGLNQQEYLILDNFIDYLGFFGYTLFHGIRLRGIGNPPNIDFFGQHTELSTFSLKTLQDCPTFSLNILGDAK